MGAYMYWTLSLHLHPDESVIEESKDRKVLGTDPLYSVFLTNKRVIFRFNSLGSYLTQSFFFHEIIDAEPSKRLLVSYIKIKTDRRSFLLNISEPSYWSEKIKGMKNHSEIKEETVKTSQEPSNIENKSDLLEMLAILNNNSLLDDFELKEKVRLLESK
jgi:hypothetical protein